MTAPTTAGELVRLAERCEAATGADDREARLLGREVLLACGKGFVAPLRAWLNPILSLDAAMTLVPEGWQCDGLRWWQGHASRCKLIGTHEVDGARWHHSSDGVVEAEAATPALALCAAALRARATLSEGEVS